MPSMANGEVKALERSFSWIIPGGPKCNHTKDRKEDTQRHTHSGPHVMGEATVRETPGGQRGSCWSHLTPRASTFLRPWGEG